jgi:hypothetical protein
MRARILYSLFALCACGLSISANAQGSSFEKVVTAPIFSIDGIARAAQVLPDQGACVFASNTLTGQLGDANILLLRVNGQGTIVQNLGIGDDNGQGYHDVAKEVVQTDKHYYITGYTRAIDTSAAHTFTALLIKVDTALNFVWQKNYILPGEEMYAEAMTPISGGDLLIAGKIYTGTDFQSFVMRTDSTGEPDWIKQYDMPHGETIECIRQLPGGDILLSGSMIFGFELVLPFVCKLNADGELLWGKYYNYPAGFVERSSFLFIRVVASDHFQLAGYTDKFGAGATDCYVVDIDSSGTVNWARTYGGTQFDEPNMVQYDNASHELVMVGSSGSFATLGVPYPMAMRIAPDGVLVGAALYGDTSVYQPARFYHSCRTGNNNRLLMGSRDAPADDLYLVGTNNDLANGCNYHPVTPTIANQTTGTGAFTATYTIPEPQINNVALNLSNFTNETLLCDQPTAVHDLSPQPAGLSIFPIPGDGTFRLEWPASFAPTLVRVYDMQGQVVWSTRDVRREIHLPTTLAGGSYLAQITDRSGCQLSARCQLR